MNISKAPEMFRSLSDKIGSSIVHSSALRDDS